jgi:hypothetical protein
LQRLAEVICPIGLIAGGVLSILRPVVIVRWVQRAHPDLPEDIGQYMWIVRVIGFGLLGVGGLILVGILGLLSR